MRIYDGSPRQDWEEVLRSIGAFADEERLKELLFLELEGGFLLWSWRAASCSRAWGSRVEVPTPTASVPPPSELSS